MFLLDKILNNLILVDFLKRASERKMLYKIKQLNKKTAFKFFVNLDLKKKNREKCQMKEIPKFQLI